MLKSLNIQEKGDSFMGLITDRLKKQKEVSGIFLCLAGPRFGGKTTTLGTLPGKTLLIDISDKESGSRGAVNMADRMGVKTFDVVTGLDCKDVKELVAEGVAAGYDNIAIDGLSALTEVELESPIVVRAGKSDKWKGWEQLGKHVTDLLQSLKKTAAASGTNIIFTVALKEKTNAEGEVTEVKLDLKGNMAEGYITGRCPYFVVSRLASDAEGKPVRILQTYSDGIYNGRLDGYLEDTYPKSFRSNPDRVEAGQPVGLAALLGFLKKGPIRVASGS